MNRPTMDNRSGLRTVDLVGSERQAVQSGRNGCQSRLVFTHDLCNLFRTSGKSWRAESDANPCKPFLSYSNTISPVLTGLSFD